MYQLAYVPIYIFRASVPSCLKLFPAYVRSFVMCLRAYNHSQNILRLTFIHRTFASKTAYLNPNLWGFVISSGAWAETTI